jgi:hypothetical protein
LFTQDPPKAYQRYLLGFAGVLALLIGVALTRFTQSVETSPKSRTVHLSVQPWMTKASEWELAQAERLVGMRLPKWGLTRKSYSANDFQVVTYVNYSTQQGVVLFLSNGADSRPLKDMLQALDDANNAKSPMIHQFLRAIVGEKVMHRWAIYDPDIESTAPVRIGKSKVLVDKVRFPQVADLQGEIAHLQKNGRSITVLSYQPGTFNEANFQTFLKKFLQES